MEVVDEVPLQVQYIIWFSKKNKIKKCQQDRGVHDHGGLSSDPQLQKNLIVAAAHSTHCSRRRIWPYCSI